MYRQKPVKDTLVTSLKSVNTIRNTSKPKEEEGEEEEEKKGRGRGLPFASTPYGLYSYIVSRNLQLPCLSLACAAIVLWT